MNNRESYYTNLKLVSLSYVLIDAVEWKDFDLLQVEKIPKVCKTEIKMWTNFPALTFSSQCVFKKQMSTRKHSQWLGEMLQHLEYMIFHKIEWKCHHEN